MVNDWFLAAFHVFVVIKFRGPMKNMMRFSLCKGVRFSVALVSASGGLVLPDPLLILPAD